MCGRYNVIPDAEAWVTAFDILREEFDSLDLQASYNTSPADKRKTQPDVLRWVPIIRQRDARRHLDLAVWSLIPKWTKGHLPDWSTANAKSETAYKLATFRGPWKHNQRCLIPANGFYEWQKQTTGPKQPWHIGMRDQKVFAFGGLWEVSVTEEGEAVESCTILTTQPNELMKPIHNRMPVIIAQASYQQWLAGDPDQAQELCQPFKAEQMAAYPISRRVNNPGFNDPVVLERAGD